MTATRPNRDTAKKGRPPMMDYGAYIWFAALFAALLALGGGIAYGNLRNRQRPHRPGKPD